MSVAGGRGKTSGADRELVLREADARGWPRDELDAAIAIESAWDPSAHNVQRFGGLIGFSPSLATKWVGSPEALWALSSGEQAPLVGRYFDLVGRKWKVPGDTYLAIAAPAFVGAPDATIVYPRDGKAWQQNPGWRGADGEITAGSIRALVLRKMKRLGMPVPDTNGGTSAFGLLLVLGIVGAVVWKAKGG